MSEKPNALKPVLIGAAVLLTPALIWAGSLLYWHWRMLRAARLWEAQYAMPMGHDESHLLLSGRRTRDELYDAGCRALPYLVESLNTSPDPRVQQDAMNRILHFVSARHGEAYEMYSLAGYPAEHRPKLIASFNEFWRREGGEYHQWWRTWSGCCAGTDP